MCEILIEAAGEVLDMVLDWAGWKIEERIYKKKKKGKKARE